MYRRNFIRVLGGGVIVAAGAAGAGCSSAVPPEAISPWQGPAAETDVRKVYGVSVVGRAPDCVARFYAVTGERRLQHPAALAIAHQARGSFLSERAG